jgi:5-methylcytosine-specific restriction endonuclease McrA
MAQRTRELERRENVERRASRRCEYCRAPQAVTGVRYHLDHIIPESLGGPDNMENLALACPMCNSYKSAHVLGADAHGLDDRRLFNPRKDNWDDDFVFDPATLQLRGKTTVGQGTVNRLRMNDAIQIEGRRRWLELNLYP